MSYQTKINLFLPIEKFSYKMQSWKGRFEMKTYKIEDFNSLYLTYEHEFDYDAKIKAIRAKYNELFDEMSKQIIQKDPIEYEIDGVKYKRKQNGRQHVRGYSLKSNGKHIYLYVWGSYSKDESERMRQRSHKNYSKYNKEECLGRYDDPDARNALQIHLQNKYGANTGQIQALFEEMQIEVDKLERTRRMKFNEVASKIEMLIRRHNLDIPEKHRGDLVKIRKIYKEYLIQAISVVNPLFELSDIRKGASIDEFFDFYDEQWNEYLHKQEKAIG
jgi:hypothetical protein